MHGAPTRVHQRGVVHPHGESILFILSPTRRSLLGFQSSWPPPAFSFRQEYLSSRPFRDYLGIQNVRMDGYQHRVRGKHASAVRSILVERCVSEHVCARQAVSFVCPALLLSLLSSRPASLHDGRFLTKSCWHTATPLWSWSVMCEEWVRPQVVEHFPSNPVFIGPPVYPLRFLFHCRVIFFAAVRFHLPILDCDVAIFPGSCKSVLSPSDWGSDF